MFKVTALALIVALCNAKEDGSSRLLLQAGAPVNPPPPPANIPPAAPVQPTPAQPAPYNPMGNMNNPYCTPYMYDAQKCMEFSFFYGGASPFNPSYNPAPASPGFPGVNSNNPYCNPMYGMYDAQKCFEFSFMYQSAPAAPAPVTPPANPNTRPVTLPQAPRAQQPANPMNNMNNPYCNPWSGMYDAQDCMRSSYGFYW